MEEQQNWREKTSVLTFNASKTFTLLLSVFLILLAALIALNIYQFKVNSDLRVLNEKIKISVFLETEELIIEKYWLERLGTFQKAVGKTLVETNGTILDALDELDLKILDNAKEDSKK